MAGNPQTHGWPIHNSVSPIAVRIHFGFDRPDGCDWSDINVTGHSTVDKIRFISRALSRSCRTSSQSWPATVIPFALPITYRPSDPTHSVDTRCHFDGLDIETWVHENLVDVLALGVRSFDVDIAAFRRLTVGTHVKLYPSIDDHHASDGYATAPLEIYRGVAAKDLPKEQRLAPIVVATIGHEGGLTNVPATKGIEEQIEVRLNNALLDQAIVENGWLVFPHVNPKLLAVGKNLVGIRVTQRAPDTRDKILLEKLELQVSYQQD